MKKLWVISLGGSKFVPDKVDEKFLREFRDLIVSHKDKKFVVVTGGGATARKYIRALKLLGRKIGAQSLEGIKITRFHAGFLARFFGKMANEEIPVNMKKVKNLLKGNQVVFCGALRRSGKNTSDGTSAKLAVFLKAHFINFTNVKGLYSADPRIYKNAKFISQVSWKKFFSITRKMKFEAGQHFVLDQLAAKVILEHKVPTYIVGSISSADKVLRGERDFGGTLIKG